MPFLFPSHDICRYKRWKFFCKTTRNLEGELGLVGVGNVCVLLNLFLRNCTFYCKKTKKDYLHICHIKKKSLSSTCDIPIIEFIVFMWKQCCRETTQNSESTARLSSADLGGICSLFCLLPLILHRARPPDPDGRPSGPWPESTPFHAAVLTSRYFPGTRG